MIFVTLSNAAYRLSLRGPEAEIEGGLSRGPPSGGEKSRGPSGRGLTRALEGLGVTRPGEGAYIVPCYLVRDLGSTFSRSNNVINAKFSPFFVKRAGHCCSWPSTQTIDTFNPQKAEEAQ